MARHLIAAPDPTTAAATVHGPWRTLSAALTGQVAALAERQDLTVTCAPGAGRGAPGCFIPALAAIELDGVHLGQDPHTCDPSRPSDRERYPALWGVFVHEAAHARHTAWNAPTIRRTAAQVEAATLLEESRIEAAHLRRRPTDQRWLRASATRLILADFTPTPPSSPAPGAGKAAAPGSGVRAAMTPWDAGCAAALLLARVSAGVLESEETAPVAGAVCEVIGASRLSALAALWCRAHQVADDDSEAMVELGRLWCDCLGIDPDQPPPPPEADAGGGSSVLAAAITAVVEAVTTADAPPPSPPAPDRAAERRTEQQARDRARRTARKVFSSHPTVTPRGPTKITGTRAATRQEQAAARRLARMLRAAAHRERAATRVTSATPPGRLRMREALAADAQRAAGATPTAEPFTQTVRRHVPTPPLRVGIACDVSGSMWALAEPVASAAWILARATAHVPDAKAATVIFGAKVRPVTRPGQPPSRVHEFSAEDNTEAFCEAVDALDAALDLSRPGAARLLVIVSDGIFTPDQREGGQRRITRLTGTGCAVLWLSLDGALAMDGTHLVDLEDPAEAAPLIGQAATRALRGT
ncbi:hypothetical protein [Actinomadura sp. SCN-SB]|uniref:hypothetical protein n=1 Tax=Actinomadura sp. SCN-SB TaxID=3373092 RepID=UPI003750A9F6